MNPGRTLAEKGAQNSHELAVFHAHRMVRALRQMVSHLAGQWASHSYKLNALVRKEANLGIFLMWIYFVFFFGSKNVSFLA
jgi:hypothetical protein